MNDLNVPWFLYYALKQLFPSKRKLSFFSFISILGVSLGVCILLIVQSVMNGFGDNIRKQLTRYQGEITIQAQEGISDWLAIKDHLSENLLVEGVSPYVDSPLLVRSQSASTFTLIRGIDKRMFSSVFPLDQATVSGSIDLLDDFSVIMGVGLAQSLNVSVGQTISVFSPTFIESFNNDEVILPIDYTVRALIQTGSPKLDAQLLLGTIRSVQELAAFENKVSGVNLRLAPKANLLDTKMELMESCSAFKQPLTFSTWKDFNQDLLFVIEQEKNLISFIIIFIILVASFSIAVALTLSVVRKTKEIGLLCAMGAKSWQIMLTFCLQGFTIGFIGSLIGMVLSWICLENRQVILEFYTQTTGRDSSFIGIYDIYSIPVEYRFSDYLNIFVLTLIIALGASIVPAIKAARLNPAEALRYD